MGSVRFSSAEHRREDAPGFIVKKKEYVPEAEQWYLRGLVSKPTAEASAGPPGC